MSDLDPVTLAVIQHGLQQVCDEMDLAFVRSAFSPVISEAQDRADGIYDKDNGDLIAQGELGLPVFVGTRVPVQTLLDYLEDGDPLDVFLDHFPSVAREQAVAVLELAKEMLVERACAA